MATIMVADAQWPQASANRMPSFPSGMAKKS
jgi:hypothetical protein